MAAGSEQVNQSLSVTLGSFAHPLPDAAAAVRASQSSVMARSLQRSDPKIPFCGQLGSANATAEPAVSYKIPLTTRRAPPEDDLLCEPAGVGNAEPVQGRGHGGPGCRL